MITLLSPWCIITSCHALSTQSKSIEYDVAYLDPSKGIINYKDNDVYIYTDFIFIPVITSIPKTPILRENLNADIPYNLCNLRDRIERMMKIAIDKVNARIPTVQPILERLSLEDLIKTEGRVKVDDIHQYKGTIRNEDLEPNLKANKTRSISKIVTDNTFNSIEETRMKQTHKIKDLLPHNRNKRVAPLILGALAVGTAVSGLAISNRVDLASMQNQVSLIYENQNQIKSRIKNIVESTNILIDNQEKMFVMVHNISKKINELVTGYNCLIYAEEDIDHFLTSWVSIVPNSFIRAVNGALLGVLTIDLLPGVDLNKMLKYYPAFSGTIFEEEPEALYKNTEVTLVRLERDPPVLEVLLSIPRILKRRFGVRYSQKACHWPHQDYYLTLPSHIEGIRSEEGTWYSADACKTSNLISLCDGRSLTQLRDACLITPMHTNITQCKILASNLQIKNEVLQTRHGILICGTSNEHAVLLKRDAYGILQTQELNINESIYIGPNNADAVIVGSIHYDLHYGDVVVNITNTYIQHDTIDNNNTMEELSLDTHIAHNERIKDLEYIVPVAQISHLVSYVIITIILIIILVLVLWYRKKQTKTRKMIGHLYGLSFIKSPNDSSQEEASSDNERA